MWTGVGRAIVAGCGALGLGACALLIGLDEGAPRPGASADAAPSVYEAGAPADGPVDAPAPVAYGDITDPTRWELFDVSGLTANDPKLTLPATYAGALFDGQRITFIPQGGCDSGAALLFDVSEPFSVASSWTLFDTRNVDDSARGFLGGVFDGKRTHFAPNCNSNPDPPALPGTTVAVHDVSAGPNGGWSTYTLAGLPLNGTHGAVFDGRFIYYAPANDGWAVRYDSTEPSNAAGSFSAFNTTTLSPAATEFTSGVSDGRYVYFVPGGGSPCSTVVARVDGQGVFPSKASWSSFDLNLVDATVAWCRFGGVFDGRFLYLVPYGAPLIVRYEVSREFGDPTSWSVFSLLALNPPATHFAGAAFDGRYIYLAPDPSSSALSVVPRYDTTKSFADTRSWVQFDLTNVKATTDAAAGFGGFIGAAFDGRYVYFVPAAAPLTAARFDARTPSLLPPTYKGSFL
jgi:hypothetical protein